MWQNKTGTLDKESRVFWDEIVGVGASRRISVDFIFISPALGKETLSLSRLRVSSVWGSDTAASFLQLVLQSSICHHTMSSTAVRFSLVAGVAIAVVAAAVGVFINELATSSPCHCNLDTSARCKLIDLYMKVPLIATHLFAFVLIPAGMYVFYDAESMLRELGAASPVAAIIGLAYLMLGICGEIGWHVGQRWFYHEEYDILNFVFYAFLTLGTAFWALGVKQKASGSSIVDIVLLLSMPITAAIYAKGAYDVKSGAGGPGKIPIYIVLSFEYAVLSWRLYKLLNKDLKVWLFPTFSVVVNLIFIALLNTYQESTFLNPLFHTLHDALGTEMGILIIILIVRAKTLAFDAARKQA